VLVEGSNCWRIARAGRGAFLIDGDAYFEAFRAAVGRAQRRVILLGWDIDSRTRLARPGSPGPSTGAGAPALTLLAFLNEILARRPELRVYALGWDFSVIFALERELLPSVQFAWNAHPRLAFRLDDAFPLSGAHHQKIVSVDGALAFSGGIDLAIRRWDTPAHLANEPDRIDPNGQPYPPMHDVQMMVDGEAAAALDDIARARWQAATGERLRPIAAASGDDDLWPEHVAPDVRDVRFGVARTMPAFRGAIAVDEVARLTVDAIAAARRFIYIENQYLTSAVAASAIAHRLQEPDGPEVVVVLPREEHGWLEQSSMGVMRAAVLGRLTAADRHGRLRLYHPVVPGLGEACVNVHSKVMVVDDLIARVGSANLSNRSMGVDTECDLVLDAALDPSAVGAIATLRNRLLAEHLGATPEAVDIALRARRSLIGAVDALRGGARSLEPLPPQASVGDRAATPPLDLTFLDGLVCDPERPAPDKLLATFLPEPMRHPVRRSLVGWLLALVVIAGVVALWRLTPLRSLLDVDRAAALGRRLAEHRAAPLLVLAGYVAGSLVLFPITLMLSATALVFSPPLSIVYCLAGALAGATVTYGVGRLIRRAPDRWLRGPRMLQIRRQLRRRGVLAIVAARLLPIGNFSIINAAAGAFRVGFRDFMLGNIIGLLPGVLALTLLAGRLGDTLRHPHPRNLILLFAIVGGFAAVMIGIRRWLARRTA
jgi:phospholipase D1/2